MSMIVKTLDLKKMSMILMMDLLFLIMMMIAKEIINLVKKEEIKKRKVKKEVRLKWNLIMRMMMMVSIKKSWIKFKQTILNKKL